MPHLETCKLHFIKKQIHLNAKSSTRTDGHHIFLVTPPFQLSLRKDARGDKLLSCTFLWEHLKKNQLLHKCFSSREMPFFFARLGDTKLP